MGKKWDWETIVANFIGCLFIVCFLAFLTSGHWLPSARAYRAGGEIARNKFVAALQSASLQRATILPDSLELSGHVLARGTAQSVIVFDASGTYRRLATFYQSSELTYFPGETDHENEWITISPLSQPFELNLYARDGWNECCKGWRYHFLVIQDSPENAWRFQLKDFQQIPFDNVPIR